MKKRVIETGRIPTLNQDGETVIVIEETTQTGFTPLSPPVTKWKNGAASYKTSSGQPVNWISEIEFEIVVTGEKLKRA